jgi:hypothetical protein
MRRTTNRTGLQGALKKIALKHADVEEDVACKGTPLESSVFKTRKKSFLFIGVKQARIKLDASASEAKQIGQKSPGSCEVGAMGWAAVSLGANAPPLATLEKWIGESYALATGPAKIATQPFKKRTR